MDPGPANMGIAKGVNEISEREYASSFSLFFIPLCLLKFPDNRAKPEDAIIRPPEILKEFKVIPKKSSK